MTALDPGNPAMVAHAIATMMDELEDWTGQYRADIQEAARSNAAYKLAWAQALLTVIGSHSGRMTVAEREAHVEVATNEDRIIAEVHDAKAKATREKLRSLQVRLDAARSLGASLRAQT